ncbi:hypothetical protein [Deinococcus sp.]|uniref:hypothetical protein n=1 Tax=Deinococcus sp. TaxID=47478 RepID=UPI0025BE559D|nr:hypothetical protein [Deinococcus sp.]
MALGTPGFTVGVRLVLPSLGMGFVLILAGGGPDANDTLPGTRFGSAPAYGSGVLLVVGLVVFALSSWFRPAGRP